MKVQYRARALEDIDAIYSWLGERTISARRVENAIFRACDMLSEHTGFGSATDEQDVLRWPLTKYPYTIFYFLGHERVVEILRVAHGKRVRNLKRMPRE